MQRNIIHNTDCLTTLRGMTDKCVDFVFFDPPYNIGKDYGIYKDNLGEAEYRKWMEEIVTHSERISKRGIAVYVGGKLTKLFFDLMPEAHLIIVHKRAVGPMNGNYFLQYHSLLVTAKPVRKTKDLWDDIRLPGEGYYFREPRYNHKGLTSLKLTSKIIHHFAEKGELVFDPFMGTGTTAVAALGLENEFIGCELNQEYIDTATKRIQEHEAQTNLFILKS